MNYSPYAVVIIRLEKSISITQEDVLTATKEQALN